jgi:hypothetical protein
MSPSNVAGEAIGTALRDMATFAIWAILVAAVVAAIASGLLALRRRQQAGLRDQTADHQDIARTAITRRTERPGSRAQPNAVYPLVGSGRSETAPDESRVPVQTP